MKFILYLLVVLSPVASMGQTLTSTIIDTIVWSGNIELNADTTFTAPQILKILSGTVVTATGPYRIEIRGDILALGTEENPILFTAADSLGVYDSALVAGWHGIHLIDNLEGIARFSYCRFEYGQANIPGSWYGAQGKIDHLEGNQGGAIRISDYKTTEFDHCTFFYNYSRTSGGAIYCDSIQKLTLSNCDFIQNKTMARGGGIFCNKHDSLLVNNTEFKQNISWYSDTTSKYIISFGWGSAICLSDWPSISCNTIKASTFFNNYSASTVTILASNSTFTNNLFTNNYNVNVLSFGRVESTHAVFNNTLANNYYKSGIPGIMTASHDMRFYNNILWNNLSPEISEDDMAVVCFSPADLQYCLIWEGRAEGLNIIQNDPLFVNPAPNYGLDSNGWEYDWSLQDDSPAINSGTPDTTGMNLLPEDLAGNPRIYGNRIDMGAYENQHVWVKINDSPAFAKQILVYPNPGTDRIMVALPENTQEAWIELFDGTRQKVLSQRVYSNVCIFMPTQLAPGMYFYRIYNQDEVFKKGKWVKLQ